MKINVAGIGIVGSVLVFGVAVLSYGARVAPAQATAQIPPPLLFSSLRAEKDTAILDITSEGDGGGIRSRFVYSPLPTPRVAVTVFRNEAEIAPDKKSYRNIRVPEPLGTVTLTPEQLTRFDNLLRFYRKRIVGRCTIEDEVTFTVAHANAEVQVETFKDATCRRFDLEDADTRDLNTIKRTEAPTLSLQQLIQIATQSAKQKSTLPYQDMPRKETRAYQSASNMTRVRNNQRRANQIAKSLPGYAIVSKQYSIEGTFLGNIGLNPLYGVTIELTPKAARKMVSFSWGNPITSKHPQYTWYQFLPITEAVEKMVERQSWIARWKAANPKRSIECNITRLTPHLGVWDDDDPNSYAFLAWRHAKLKGKPYCYIFLRRADGSWITVYLGKEDSRALVDDICESKTDKTFLPIDNVSPRKAEVSSPDPNHHVLRYSPADKIPDYAVVLPDGTIQRNTHP